MTRALGQLFIKLLIDHCLLWDKNNATNRNVRNAVSLKLPNTRIFVRDVLSNIIYHCRNVLDTLHTCVCEYDYTHNTSMINKIYVFRNCQFIRYHHVTVDGFSIIQCAAGLLFIIFYYIILNIIFCPFMFIVCLLSNITCFSFSRFSYHTFNIIFARITFRFPQPQHFTLRNSYANIAVIRV